MTNTPGTPGSIAARGSLRGARFKAEGGWADSTIMEGAPESGSARLGIAALVVVLAVGVAVPAIARARTGALEREAKLSLADAASAVIVLGLNAERFPDEPELSAQLPRVEPDLTWLDAAAPSSGADEISVARQADGVAVTLAARAASGDCFLLRVRLGGTMEYHRSSATPCTPAALDGVPATGWR